MSGARAELEASDSRENASHVEKGLFDASQVNADFAYVGGRIVPHPFLVPPVNHLFLTLSSKLSQKNRKTLAIRVRPG